METVLNTLSASDVHEIHHWPEYPAEFVKLDYALRVGGWLDQFPSGDRNRRYGLRSVAQLVGFTILANIRDKSAELYVAIHPNHLGEGFGRIACEYTLDKAFKDLDLARVYLKVRVWHQRGIQLYHSLGFEEEQLIVETINGEEVAFKKMGLSLEDWERRVRPVDK